MVAEFTETLRTALTGAGLGLPLLAFALAGVAVFLIASRLSHHADAIADATGLGRVWIGALLLSAATSLPEITTDLSAAAIGALDIGVGDLMGSTLANMAILALLDIVYARRRILDSAAFDHILIGTLAVMLTAVAALAIAAGGFGRLGPVGIETVLIVGLYLFGMKAAFAVAQARGPAPTQQMELGESRATLLRGGVRGMLLAALGLLAVAPLLVVCAEAIAIEAGLTQSFVGTTLVGFTTSFPEIAASIAAVRMGAIDLAVGNIFGSNAFNMTILFGMDLAHGGAPVLTQVSQAHVQSAVAAVVAIALGMLAILARAQRRPAVVRIESLLILVAWGVAAWLLTRTGQP